MNSCYLHILPSKKAKYTKIIIESVEYVSESSTSHSHQWSQSWLHFWLLLCCSACWSTIWMFWKNLNVTMTRQCKNTFFVGLNVVNPGTIEYTAVWMDNVNDRRWKASPFSAVPVCCSIRIRFSFLLFWWYNSSGTFVIKNYTILNKRNNLMPWITTLATRQVLFILWLLHVGKNRSF